MWKPKRAREDDDDGKHLPPDKRQLRPTLRLSQIPSSLSFPDRQPDSPESPPPTPPQSEKEKVKREARVISNAIATIKRDLIVAEDALRKLVQRIEML